MTLDDQEVFVTPSAEYPQVTVAVGIVIVVDKKYNTVASAAY